MIQMKMGENDVMDITPLVPQRSYLMQRRLFEITWRTHQLQENAHHWRRLSIVLRAKTGIDQDKPVFCLDQQAVNNRFHFWEARV